MSTMEFVKGLLQEVAEAAASYSPGQALLKQVDRVLWTVEKSARWALPPALDDDNPSATAELVRPLPWIFFLGLLIALRITRESISLVNLVLGKPPLRAADVVSYIQSKRRYIRSLKYQGNRQMRSRSNNAAATTGATMHLLASLQSLLGATMCFKRPSDTKDGLTDDNDQVLIVKKKKRGAKGRESGYASPVQDENSMDKLIEKMVDMYRDSDDDSDYTLTNAPSTKSNTSASDEDFTRDTVPEPEPASSTPKKEHDSIPIDTPEDCSAIHEESLLGSSAGADKAPPPVVGSTDFINAERKAEQDSSKKSSHIANGQTGKASSSNIKKEIAKRQDSSEVPLAKVTSDGQDKNGTEAEGSYCKKNKTIDQNKSRHQTQKEDYHNPIKSGRSKARNESKIRAPSRKSKK